MTSPLLVAGIDSSTQSCKVIIRRIDTGDIVRSGHAPHPAGTEVHPDHWWDALNTAVKNAGGLDDVAAVSIAAQQHGMVALAADGTVVRPALLWNDTRSAPQAARLVDQLGAKEFAMATGSVPVASFTVTKLAWVAEMEPENAAKIHAVALPHDWLTWRLLGYGPRETSPLGPDFSALTTDRSDASGTGYYSSAQNAYLPELLEAAFGRVVELPRVVGPGDRAGTTPEGIVVGAGAGDNAGAALGLGATPGDVVVSIGTSGTVFSVSAQASQDESGLVAGFADASGHYLPLIATLNAARVIDATRSLLGIDFAELERQALSAPPGSDGVVVVPYFEGERTPNLPEATGSFHGLTLASYTPAHLARASIEGVLCSLAEGLDAVINQGVNPSRVLIIGGSAQNPAVHAVAATIFEQPVEIPRPAEYVALGAGVQAAWALTGERPHWLVESTALEGGHFRPEIRETYAHYRALSHPTTSSRDHGGMA
jgi:xylulokinase